LIELTFQHGTIVVRGSSLLDEWPNTLGLKYDERVLAWRGHANLYRDVVTHLSQQKICFSDQAKSYEKIQQLKLAQEITPRPHQTQALKHWLDANGRGTVELPTGAGKSILAVLAIARIMRPTLVVVPTIDLLIQWQRLLTTYFGMEIGALGGGENNLRDITVATYDSAIIHNGSIGPRFGFVVFDEAHHLPAPQYLLAATGAIAPFRLGLSATIERTDGKEALVYEHVGPLVFKGRISDMVESVLAPYDHETVFTELLPDERMRYEAARSEYLSFLRKHAINVGGPQGWAAFVKKASFLPGGRNALKAHRLQKEIAQSSRSKIEAIWKILQSHGGERIIVFTDKNDFAYRLGTLFVAPVLTHQTKLKERKLILDAFREGRLTLLITSKVLNEGVDVPEASVGIVASGSAAVREHVQRLGRILRHQPGKRAKLYEILSNNTAESSVSERRRQHDAYQRSH